MAPAKQKELTKKDKKKGGVRNWFRSKLSSSTEQRGHSDAASSIQSTSSEAETTTHVVTVETRMRQPSPTRVDRASPELITNSTTDQVSNTSPLTTNNKQSTTRQPKNICELWNEAYDDLKVKEEDLIRDYEDILSKLGSISTELLGSGMSRQKQMQALLEKNLAQMKKDEWKLMFSGKDIPVKDLAAPVIGIIKWAETYVDGAVSANPYASIAWAGVSLLLPLFLNPSKQSASLVKALEVVSNVIVRSSMRETLYSRQNETHNDGEQQEYGDTLKELYIRILKFQATSTVYFSKKNIFRLGLDIVKWNDWDTLSQDIIEQENTFISVYELWKDSESQTESEYLAQRHVEIININKLIARDMTSLREVIEDAQKNHDRQELLQWLTTINPSSNYNTAYEKLKANTGVWLIKENYNFRNWKTEPNSFIWLNGKAGSGKTVLSSTVIKHLEDQYHNNPAVAVVYYYYSFTDKEKQTVDGMLCSLIKQLCCRRPDTPAPLDALREYKDKGHRPSKASLQYTLAATLHGFSDVFLIIDSLDECPYENDERETLLEHVLEIHKGNHENLHLLCTSRREPDIKMALEPLFTSNPNTDIEISSHKGVEHDIGLYVDTILANKKYKSWSEDLKSEAREILIGKAEGMFQYVACQFEELSKHLSPNKIRQALKDLPRGLDATYDRMLIRIDYDYQKQVASVLKWLAFSLRPLNLDEVAEVFILDHENEQPFNENNRLCQPEDVLVYLSSLVTKSLVTDRRTEETRTEIKLAHFSIKEYLTSARISQGPAKEFATTEMYANLHISEACLAYHLFLSQTILVTKEEYKRLKLWNYIIKNWHQHLERVPQKSWTSSVTTLTLRLLTPKSQGLLNMIRISNPDNYRGSPAWDINFDKLSTPLYYAASLNAIQIATFLLDRGADVNTIGGQYGTALQAASWKGYENLVKVLLDRGADVNTIGGQYGTALQAASYKGYENLVRILLDRGADINAIGGEYGTALQVASFGGYENIVKVLLDQGADVNTIEGHFGTALQAASCRGYENIVKVLLDRGADINTIGGHFGTALQAASFGGYENIVKVLLDRGADVNAIGGYFGTALQAASWRGHENVIKVLLDRGADVNAIGGEYGTALQAASLEGYENIVKVLLDQGADVNSIGGRFGTALQAASLRGQENIVNILLDRGADINIKGGLYGNAVQAAVTQNHIKIAGLLLQKGAVVQSLEERQLSRWRRYSG